MAIMVPSYRRSEEFNRSRGERLLYNELKKQLSDEYVIFHSVNVLGRARTNKGYPVDKEIDFIVFHPQKGIICIEVKHGEIRFRDNGIFQKQYLEYDDSSRNKENYVSIDPLKQIAPAKYSLIKHLKDNLGSRIEYSCTSVAFFTSVRSVDMHGKLPLFYRGRILFKEDLETLSESLDNHFDYHNGRIPKDKDLVKETKNSVINEIAPSCDAIPILSERIKENEFSFRKMTQEQIKVLDFLEKQKNAVIEGMAGSGKTVIALEKAKRLSESRKVLVLCFNRMIKDYMKISLQKYSSNIDVMNIYDLGLAYRYLKSGEFHWTRQMELLNDILQGKLEWDYDDLIIDEAQDYTKGILEMLYNIQKKSNGHFYAFYDIHQKTHNNMSEEWLDKFHNRYVLHSNCRNTMEIAEACCKIVGENIRKPSIKVSGQRPKWHINRTEDELKKTLETQLDYYIEQGISLSDIVLLTIKSSNDPSGILCNEKNLKAASFNIGKYKVSGYKKEGHLLFTTARKFKGNESDIVIVVDINEESLWNDNGKKLFYIAVSRAKHIAEVHCVMDRTEEESLYRSISREKRNEPFALREYLAMEKVNYSHGMR